MAILVIIDMQPEYRAAQDRRLQHRIRRRIREHDGPVCIVEYEGRTKTYPGIVKACRGKRMFRCVKSQDDGGQVVVGATFGEKLGRHSTYILCGVNTPYCVTSTARGILHWRKDARVVLDYPCCRACGDGPMHKDVTEAAIDVFIREDPKRRRRAARWSW